MIRLDHDLFRFFSPKRLTRGTLVLVAAALIAGCSAFKPDVDKTAGWSADRLYKDARSEMSDSNWKDARTRLEAVESRYPFGIYAQQALVDLAYVDWKDEDSDQALAAISGRNFVMPDDVKRMVQPVMAHRLILRPESRLRKVTPAALLHEIVGDVRVPVPAQRDDNRKDVFANDR